MAKPAAKLPVQQFVILAICRFAEPVIFTSVFPYLPEMIRSLGVEEKDVAQWVGLTTAIFCVCQCITAIPWGSLSDRVGRKPVILACLTCTMVFSVLFGLSTSLPMVIVTRACIGLGNGNIGIIRTVVAELVPERELQPLAFSLMPLVWTMGSILGPAVGGALVNPVEKHPSIFGNSHFFKKYPFVLPNLVTAVLFIIGLTTGFLFLRETLESKKNKRDCGLVLGDMLKGMCCGSRAKPAKQLRYQNDERTPLLDDTEQAPNPKQGDDDSVSKKDKETISDLRWSDILTTQSSLSVMTYAFLGMHTLAYDSVIPVFLNHPTQSLDNDPDVKLPFKFTGGFAMDSEAIGILFTITSIVGMVVQFVIYPPAAKRFGVLNCLKAGSLVFPLMYFITPFVVLFPTDLGRQSAMLLLMCIKLTAVIFAFPSVTILLTNSASSMRVLATLNGVATSATAICRAVGPAALGALYSKGVKMGYMIFPWWFLALVSVLSALPPFWIVEMDGNSSEDHNEDTNEDDSESSITPETNGAHQYLANGSVMADNQRSNGALNGNSKLHPVPSAPVVDVESSDRSTNRSPTADEC